MDLDDFKWNSLLYFHYWKTQVFNLLVNTTCAGHYSLGNVVKSWNVLQKLFIELCWQDAANDRDRSVATVP